MAINNPHFQINTPNVFACCHASVVTGINTCIAHSTLLKIVRYCLSFEVFLVMLLFVIICCCCCCWFLYAVVS